MKTIRYIRAVTLLGAALSGACLAVPAQAQSIEYTFCQNGYSEGAFVTGTFSGIDFDADGQLSSFDGEVTGFSMSFSGNSIVPAFGLGFGELFGLVYDIGSLGIGDGVSLDIEGIGAVGAFAYLTGQGPTGTDGGLVSDSAFVVIDTSPNLALVNDCAAVPDGGATLGLLALSCGALLFCGRALRRN